MANSVDPNQTAPTAAVWSASALSVYGIFSETLVFEIFGPLSYILEDSNFDFRYTRLQTVETRIRGHVLPLIVEKA